MAETTLAATGLAVDDDIAFNLVIIDSTEPFSCANISSTFTQLTFVDLNSR